MAGRIDGMFPNLPDADLDGVAVPTEPFVLERWSFVQRRDSQNPARPRGHTVGVVLGSNESRFLRGENLAMFDAIPNMTSLVKLLASRRVPYGLVDDWSFDTEARKLGYSPDTFQSALQRYVPLQAYFSKPFIAANPSFLSRFNDRIKDCVHDGRKVATWEREILYAAAQRFLTGRNDALLHHLKRHRMIDGLDPLLSRIDALMGADKDWQKALSEDRINILMEVILASPASDLMRAIARDHPLITEIFLVNEHGFIIGLNRLTSDYWQGDEAAAEAILRDGAAIHFSAFEYDLSTRRFQVQVSLPIVDPETGPKPIGLITVGIDAASLLAGTMH